MRALLTAVTAALAILTLQAGSSVPAISQQTPPAPTSTPTDAPTDKAEKAREAAAEQDKKAKEAQQTPSGQAGTTEPSVRIEKKNE